MAIPALARLAAAVLTNEDGRRTAGKVLALILSPLIILAAFLCCFGDGASQHNNAVVSAAFYGTEFSDKVPKEYRTHITEMQEAFSLLDSATVYVNQKAEEGSLDPVQVKAIFFALCFGDNAPTRSAADRFVDCFYKTETRTRMVTVTQEDGTEELVEETYEVAVPLSVEDVYEKLTTWRGRVVTDAERSNAVDIYAIVMGSMGGDTFNGAYEPGGSAPIELDASMLTDPTTKNAADLVTYVANAWNSGWGYVWGTYGQVLTPELLQYMRMPRITTACSWAWTSTARPSTHIFAAQAAAERCSVSMWRAVRQSTASTGTVQIDPYMSLKHPSTCCLTSRSIRRDGWSIAMWPAAAHPSSRCWSVCGRIQSWIRSISASTMTRLVRMPVKA